MVKEMPIPDAPHPTDHAQLAWWKRNPNRDIDIQTAWRESPPIKAPNYIYDNARLHEPSGIILLARNNALTTVLFADAIKLEDDHLVECPQCEQRYEKTADMNDGGCPWCDGPGPEVQAASFTPLSG